MDFVRVIRRSIEQELQETNGLAFPDPGNIDEVILITLLRELGTLSYEFYLNNGGTTLFRAHTYFGNGPNSVDTLVHHYLFTSDQSDLGQLNFYLSICDEPTIMRALNLARFPHLRTQEAVKTLNRMKARNTQLIVHQVAVATGCDIAEAIGMVYLLLFQQGGQAFILTYHNTDPTDPPVHTGPPRPLLEGLPPLPIVCTVCGRKIESAKELSFDLEFRVAEDIVFISEQSHVE